uniref:DNA-dependent protein kinase catalytic subunit isoform X2 n=1 Tax=Myxine glutinosa TaxID=7769 RepID=UPI00358ED0A1
MSGSLLSLLRQLHDCILASCDPRADEIGQVARALVEDIKSECQQGQNSLDLHISLLFSKDLGIFTFLRKSQGHDKFRDSRHSLLDLLSFILDLPGLHGASHYPDIKDICLTCFTLENAAKNKIAALVVLIKVLKLAASNSQVSEMDLSAMFERLYSKLAQSPRLSDTVLEMIYEVLGVMAEYYPEAMLSKSPCLLRLFLQELHSQMEGRNQRPPLVVGALKGLTSLLVNFTQTSDEDSPYTTQILDYTLKALKTMTNRYAVPLAGLGLLSRHIGQFGHLVLQREELHQLLYFWSDHKNRDVSRAGSRALEAYLIQVSVQLTAEGTPQHLELQYWLKRIYEVLHNDSATPQLIGVSIRVLGHFAAPCANLGSSHVHFMFEELLTRAKQCYLGTSTDRADGNEEPGSEGQPSEESINLLPSFLDSLSSTLVHLNSVPGRNESILVRLAVMQIDIYPFYGPQLASSVPRSLLRLFISLSGKGALLSSFLKSVVHQALVSVCSRTASNSDIVEEAFEDDSEGDAGQFGGMKEMEDQLPRGLGPKKRVITYRDFLDLWKCLLDCSHMKGIVSSHLTLAELERLIVDEFFSSIIKTLHTLDLTTVAPPSLDTEVSSIDMVCEEGPETFDTLPTVQPARPCDLKCLHVLAEFCRDLMHESFLSRLDHLLWPLGHELMVLATKHPLASGLYRLLAITAHGATVTRHFLGYKPLDFALHFGIEVDQRNKHDHFYVLAKFAKEVCYRLKQFKGELLAAALTFILAIPAEIVRYNLPHHVPTMQMALRLGLSFPPLAEAALVALECWAITLPSELLAPHLPLLLPALEGYLNTTEINGENTWKLLPNSSSSRRKVPVKLFSKTKSKVLQMEESAMAKLQLRLLRTLGSLGGRLNRFLITAHTVEQHVTWGGEKRLAFPIPFSDMKPVIHLDDLLPRTAELAIGAADRHTKVAACEFLHSAVTVVLGRMIPSQAAEARGQTGSLSLHGILRKLLPTLLHLACDADPVPKQMFEPLVLQMIHWFTSSNTFEQPETVALLNSLLDGVCDPTNASLRDFSGMCLHEFLSWSQRQTKPNSYSPSPHCKSLLKRLQSLALHPSSSHRLGAALAFNAVYTEIRKDEFLVNQFTLEFLVVFVLSLALTNMELSSCETVQQCDLALDHLAHIVQHKLELFLERSSSRRVPRGFPLDSPVTLKELVHWLLQQCGRPVAPCRHKALELFSCFVPLLPGHPTVSNWLARQLGIKGSSFLINCLEGGGDMDGGGEPGKGILYQPYPSEPLTQPGILLWLERLLAPLDSYATLLGNKLVSLEELFTGLDCRSRLPQALAYFIEQMVTLTTTSSFQPFGTSGTDMVTVSPTERQVYVYTRFTVLVRFFEFVTTVAQSCPLHCHKILPFVLDSKLSRLIATAINDPVTLGFNPGDLKAAETFPKLCSQIMRAIVALPLPGPRDGLLDAFRPLLDTNLVQQLSDGDVFMRAHDREHIRHVLSVYSQLNEAGLLSQMLPFQISGRQLLNSVYKALGVIHISLDPQVVELLRRVLLLVFSMGIPVEDLVDLLIEPVDKRAQNVVGTPTTSASFGEKLLTLLPELVSSELLQHPKTVVEQLASAAKERPQEVFLILTSLLDEAFRQRRASNSQALAGALLAHWQGFESWWSTDEGSTANSSQDYQSAVLSLLLKLLQIDSSLASDPTKPGFMVMFTMFQGILKNPRLSLSKKLPALDLVACFDQLPNELASELKAALAQLTLTSFPLSSSEFPRGSFRFVTYANALQKLMAGLETSGSAFLLHLLVSIICREEKHALEESFQACLIKITNCASTDVQVSMLRCTWDLCAESVNASLGRAVLFRVLLPLLHRTSEEPLRAFFLEKVRRMVGCVQERAPKHTDAMFESWLTFQLCCLRALEVMYLRLPCADFHGSSARLCLAFQDPPDPEGKILSKTMMKACYNLYIENMIGETQLLELRRQQHCAAFCCNIALLSAISKDPRFFNKFLFEEIPEKHVIIYENLVDPKREYSFPMEVERSRERRKHLVALRCEAQGLDKEEREHVFLPNTSSLTELQSQFDFSTGFQSSSGIVADTKPKPQVRKEPWLKKGLDLEWDDLNRQECMVELILLIQHMQQERINPQFEQGVAAEKMPPWMEALHRRMTSQTTHRNVLFFLARLVSNCQEVFRPYANFWLTPMLSVAVSPELQSLGINGLLNDITVTLLSWESIAIPKNAAVGVLAQRLIDFFLEKCGHRHRALLRHNLEMIRTIFSTWKSCLTVPYRQIYERFSKTNVETDDITIGIQLLGVVLASDLPPYHPDCGVDRQRFFKALLKNLSETYPRKVFTATAEVLGLVLQQLDSTDKEAQKEVENLVTSSLMNASDGIFIDCLNHIAQGYPSLIDRLCSRVLYLVPKLHGTLRTSCLELLAARPNCNPHLYEELQSRDLLSMLTHRDDNLQQACLKLVKGLLPNLNPGQLLPLFPCLTSFLTHHSSACRRRAYDCLMWLYDTFWEANDDTEVNESQRVFLQARDGLLQAVADEDPILQQTVRSFWDSDARMPVGTQERSLTLLSLHPRDIEQHFLPLGTGLLLGLAARSADFERPLFDQPISDNFFQEYEVNANWRYRSSMQTPHFVETQMSLAGQSVFQSGTMTVQRSKRLQITQMPDSFSSAQATGSRGTYDWISGNTLDMTTISDDYPGKRQMRPSSALMLPPAHQHRPYPIPQNFGSTRLATLNETIGDLQMATQKQNISWLKRRLTANDQSTSAHFARREVQRQKKSKDEHIRKKMQKEAGVTLYRSYRKGDVPDIQISHSSLLRPMQALAQRDPTVARLLLSALLCGVVDEVQRMKGDTEQQHISQKFTMHTNRLMASSLTCFPPFVACIQDVAFRCGSLSKLNPGAVSSASLGALQQATGILLLEESLIQYPAAAPNTERPTKRSRGPPAPNPPDTARWLELARLYRSLGDWDTVGGLFSERLASQKATQQGLDAEARGDFVSAARIYNEALGEDDWGFCPPTHAEKDYWERARMECYRQLCSWQYLDQCTSAALDDDLDCIWDDPFNQECYLPAMMESKTRLAVKGNLDQAFFSFVDKAMEVKDRRDLLESYYPRELATLYLLQGDHHRARHYLLSAFRIFTQQWAGMPPLLIESRKRLLQQLQPLTEELDFLEFMAQSDNFKSLQAIRPVIDIWAQRLPDIDQDPATLWDDVISSRCFYLAKIRARFATDNTECTNHQQDLLTLDSLISDLRFNMELAMVQSATTQANLALAELRLNRLKTEMRCNVGRHTRWSKSYVAITNAQAATLPPPKSLETLLQTWKMLENCRNDANSCPAAQSNHYCLVAATYQNISSILLRHPELPQENLSNLLQVLFHDTKAKETSTLQMADVLLRKALATYNLAANAIPEEYVSGISAGEHNGRTELARGGGGGGGGGGGEASDCIVQASETYIRLASFCDDLIRQHEESDSVPLPEPVSSLAVLVMRFSLRAMRLGSHEARFRFPRLLQFLTAYPNQTFDIMIEEAPKMACWQFLPWLGQLVPLLDRAEAPAVRGILDAIAEAYPQALAYPLRISSDGFLFPDTQEGQEAHAYVERLKSSLDRDGMIARFIRELQQLNNPDLIFKDWSNDILAELEKPQKNKEHLVASFLNMYANVGDSRAPAIGPWRHHFAKKYGPDLQKIFGTDGIKLAEMTVEEFTRCSSDLWKKMQSSTSRTEPGNLKEYSPWLSQFQPGHEGPQLEIPGQYTGHSKPQPEYHVRITGFDERVQIMNSMRKPKCLVLRGDDEREHKFLVKGGEDLRQDQRIQQLLGIMNSTLGSSASARNGGLPLITYTVIPLTARLGLIQWLENTCPLKEILRKNMSNVQQDKYSGHSGPLEHFNRWIRKFGQNASAYLNMYNKATHEEVLKSFRQREALVPACLLRRSLLSLAISAEAFLTLRASFARSLASMSAAHWLLGIGDRHLSNIMISLDSGCLIGIDFGHAFGSATQFLPIPELMPFRLTRQILGALQPFREAGLLRANLSRSLRRLRTHPDLLLSTMQVFITEPSLDWKGFELKQLRRGGQWTDLVDTTEVDWFPRQKISIARRKLEGANPAAITCEELKLGHSASSALHALLAVAKGDPTCNVRARLQDTNLSPEDQADCLLDQATDPNILGRTFVGWEPWM